MRKESSPRNVAVKKLDYRSLLNGVTELLEASRHAAARSVNAVLTATYWEIGRRMVEYEQSGKERAEYGRALLKRMSQDLTSRFGRGFSERNLEQMRGFYLGWKISQTPSAKFEDRGIFQTLSGKSQQATMPISQTVSAKSQKPQASPSKSETPSRKLSLKHLAASFPLPWSHYVRLLALDDPHKREFYEEEARRGGWSVRQLDRQINSMLYERIALSRDKAPLLKKTAKTAPRDRVTPEDEIKDPYVLEFLGLREPHSEKDLEGALIQHLADFLLELGNGFTFVARQKRLQIGSESYYIDLLFYHRHLKCLIAIDLKIGKFTHEDAGQMNLYLNYLRENEMVKGEKAPIGLILSAEKDEIVAHYALGGLSNKVFASRYKLQLPDPKVLRREIAAERRRLEIRLLNHHKSGD